MKILAIPNAHALAHVSRLLEVTRVLRSRGHGVVFAGHGKYLEIARSDDFETYELPYIPVQHLLRVIRSQKLWQWYRREDLERYIDDELRLYEQVKPDLVLLDNRPTGRTSAEKAGIKTAAVLNVHMSNYRAVPFYSYRQLAGDFAIPGLDTADRLENRMEISFYDRFVMGDLNRIRTDLGLPRLYAYEHEEGELALLSDVPEFNPVTNLPAYAHYIGPLTWHNTLPAPACLEKLDPARPIVYFSLGSDSLDELVANLGQLAREGIQIVVATGSASQSSGSPTPEGIYLEPFVNVETLLPHCAIVCCHGGNGTLYQALARGLPSVVVWTHAEQAYGGKRIQQLGLGRALSLRKLRRLGMGHLVKLVKVVLRDSEYVQKAQAFADHVKAWNGPQLAANLLERHMSGV